MTTPATDINCRCYDFNQDPLFIKLTTDYPGDWTQHKHGYRVKWGKVTAYVYRTGSGEEVCVDMKAGGVDCSRKANDPRFVDDPFHSCLDEIEYQIQSWNDPWISQLSVFKNCPPKIRSYFTLTVSEAEDDAIQSIEDLKSQLKAEQKTLRQLNKLKGVLGL